MNDLNGIRKWPMERKLLRLKELGEKFRAAWDADQIPPELEQDEAVVLWLEVMRSAFPDASPLDRLHDLVMYYEEPSAAFGLMSLRFRETKELVERFKTVDKREQLRLRPQLAARGMI